MKKTELIDLAATLDEMCKYCGSVYPSCDGACRAKEYIAHKAPAVDAVPVARCKKCKWRDECFRNIRNDGNRDGMTELEQVYQASMRQIEAGYALDDRGKAIRAYVASLVTDKDVGGKDGKDKDDANRPDDYCSRGAKMDGRALQEFEQVMEESKNEKL